MSRRPKPRTRRYQRSVIRRGLRRLRFSLSARLMLLFVVTALVLVVLIGTTVRFATRDYFASVLGPHAVRYLDYIRADIGDPPDLERARALARELPVEIQLHGDLPSQHWTSNAFPTPVEKLRFRSVRAGRGRWLSVSADGERFVLRTRVGDHRLYLAIDQRGRRGDGPRARVTSLVAIALLLLTLAACYWAIRKLFQPLGTIVKGVDRIGSGDLSGRLNIRRRDELGELGARIDAMTDDIQKMLDGKRQLLLAVSHELRSPLTRARVSAELLERSAARDGLIDDLREMQTLIDELLEAERLGGGHGPVQRARVDAGALAAELLRDHFAHDAVRFTPPAAPVFAELDSARVRLLLKNLLDNALRHGRTAPRLDVDADATTLYYRVADDGPGVAPEQLALLSEPFYRADPARQRRTGGYGLGLYLCRAVAEAHGGRLELHSRVGEGTTITAVLPLSG